MVKKIALIAAAIIGVAVIAVLGMAATKPDQLHVERSALISAPPAKIFPIVNDLHRWTEWSPYEAKDPKMKRTYSGADKGKGAIYGWEGNDEVGSGRMEIAEATEPSKIGINLHFIKPFEGDNLAEFTFVPEGHATKVTWGMTGESPFMCKIMQVFMNMDDMCGNDFAKGLAKLKTVVEKAP